MDQPGASQRRTAGLNAFRNSERGHTNQGRKRKLVLYIAVGGVGAGVAIVLHAEVNMLFTKLADRPELPLLGYLYLVLYVVLWILFVWQPGAIRRVLTSLRPITGDDLRLLDDDAFLECTHRPAELSANRLTRGIFLILVLPATLIFALVSGQFWHESPPVLLGINPFQFYGPWIVLFFFNAYFLTAVLIRHCFAVDAINHIVTAHAVSPKAFHTDGANGLAAIGRYAAETGSLAVLYGLWIGTMLAIAHYRDADSPDAWQLVTLLMFYVIALALLAVLPLLGPHAVMRAHKIRRLELVATQIRARLESDLGALEDATRLERTIKLRDWYRFVAEAYGEWPVHVALLKGFSLAAVLALVSQLVTIVPKLSSYLAH
jgi:hypothetical protein